MTEQINTPELRFPEFKEEWIEYYLGNNAMIKGRLGWKGLKQSEYLNNGYAYLIANKHIKNGRINWEETDQINKFRYDESPEIALETGDLIFSKDGALGNPALIKNLPKPASINSTMMLVRLNKNNFIPNFFYQILLGPLFNKLIYLKVSGSSIPHLFQADMKDFKFKAPSLPEQEKIGNFFSKLDRQIELEEKKLELLEQQKRGYMQKIFTQELKFKNSQLENIKWSYKTLEELNSFFTDGNYGESYPKSEDMSDKNDGVAFLRGSNLKKGRITLEDANYISKKKHSELTTGHLFLDDIVIAVRGSLGAVGYVNENMVGNNINSQLAIIRTSDSLLYGKYLLYYLMSNQGKKELLSRVTGTALKQLPIKQIKQIKVPVPKLYEQHKIANFLSELDNLIDNQTEKIELLKERNKGFLQKMFV